MSQVTGFTRWGVRVLRHLDAGIVDRLGGLLPTAVMLSLLTACLRLPLYATDRIYYNPLTNPLEVALTVVAAVVLLALTSSFFMSFIVIQLVLLTNYLKFFFMREGLLPADLTIIPEAWEAAGASIRGFVILGVSLLAVCMLALTHRGRWRLRAALLTLVAMGTVGAYYHPAAVKASFFPGDYERFWDVGSEFQARGFFTAFAMSALNTEILRQELARLPTMARAPAFDLRNAIIHPPERPYDLHIVFLESFMDPDDMTALRLERISGAPETRRPDRGKPAYVYSPTVGGKSARAEFEVLCGVPDFELLGSITFNQLGGRPIGCLPSLLSQVGYRTFASSATSASFFNYGAAYKSMGFDVLRLAPSLALDDMDGSYLSDRSALHQNLAFLREQIAARGQQPIFNYVFLGAGHFPFARDESRRPDLVKTDPPLEVVDRIVNHSLHALDALHEFLDGLRSLERPSVVILLGDHLPPVSDTTLEQMGYIGFDPRHPITEHRTFVMVMKDFVPLPQPNIAMWELPYVALALLDGGTGCIATHPAREKYLVVKSQIYDRAVPADPVCTGMEASLDKRAAQCAGVQATVEDMSSVYLDLVKRSHVGVGSAGVSSAEPRPLVHAEAAGTARVIGAEAKETSTENLRTMPSTHCTRVLSGSRNADARGAQDVEIELIGKITR